MRPLPALAAALLLAAPAARAQVAERTGLELAAELGPGYVHSSARMNGITQSVSGLGAGWALTAGWAVIPDLTVGGQLWGTLVYGPRFHTRGPAGGGGGLVHHAWGFGPTVKYHLATRGIFAGATPSVVGLRLSDNDAAPYRWRWGLGARLEVGKEWTATQSLDVGLAAYLQLGANQQVDRASPRWSTPGGGVVLSAAFR